MGMVDAYTERHGKPRNSVLKMVVTDAYEWLFPDMSKEERAYHIMHMPPEEFFNLKNTPRISLILNDAMEIAISNVITIEGVFEEILKKYPNTGIKYHVVRNHLNLGGLKKRFEERHQKNRNTLLHVSAGNSCQHVLEHLTPKEKADYLLNCPLEEYHAILKQSELLLRKKHHTTQLEKMPERRETSKTTILGQIKGGDGEAVRWRLPKFFNPDLVKQKKAEYPKDVSEENKVHFIDFCVLNIRNMYACSQAGADVQNPEYDMFGYLTSRGLI
jgi:hypothetical protein